MAKPKGQLPKAYLRIDPNLDSTHPRPGDFIRLLCAAHRQPQRGRFRDREVLDLAVGPEAAAYLINREDVIPERGRLYVDGWDEWQEGDFTVGERMARVRSKRQAPRKRVTRELRSERNSTVTVRQGGKAVRQQGVKAARRLSTSPPLAAAKANGGEKHERALSSVPLPDHDPKKPLEAELAGLVAELAGLIGSTHAHVLESVSATPAGKHLTEIRGASPRWLRQSIRDCARFRSENVDGADGPAAH